MTDLTQFTRLDTTQSLDNPCTSELIARVDKLISSGLWKIGQCFEDCLGKRPRDASHYDPQYFDRDGAILLAYGLVDTARAEQLETAAIQRAKFYHRTGVNTRDKDAVSHDNYSLARPGAVYAVPVLLHFATTQEEFKEKHVSYYLQRKHGSTTEEERKVAKRAKLLAKRAKLLKQLIAAIPMQQLQQAFESPRCARRLCKLQHKHGFKESNTTIYMELRALFDERY